jgi:hypothetical protein
MDRDLSDKHLTCQFGFSVEKWYGQPLLGLPYFEQIERFAQSLLQSGKLEFECLYKGNHLFTGKSTNPFPKARQLAEFVAFLDKARFVAKQLGLNPTFRRISGEDHTDIENLYELFKHGEYSTRVKGLQMSATILVKPELLDAPAFKDPRTPRQILLTFDNYTSMRFFGTEVDVGPFHFVATSVVLANWNEVHRKLVGSKEPKKVKVEFAGKGKCSIIRRLPRIIEAQPPKSATPHPNL